jgi:hypothetical protein
MITIDDIEARVGTAFQATVGTLFRHPPTNSDPCRWITCELVSAYEYPRETALRFEPEGGLGLVRLVKDLPSYRSPSRRHYPFRYGNRHGLGEARAAGGVWLVQLEVQPLDDEDPDMLTLVWAPVGEAGLLVVAPHDSDPAAMLGPLPELPRVGYLDEIWLGAG